jgi:hypothetical protein
MKINWKAEKEKMEKNWKDQKESLEREITEVRSELRVEKDGRAQDAANIRKQEQENIQKAANEAEARVRAEQEILSQNSRDSHGREIGDHYRFKPPEAFFNLTR